MISNTCEVSFELLFLNKFSFSQQTQELEQRFFTIDTIDDGLSFHNIKSSLLTHTLWAIPSGVARDSGVMGRFLAKLFQGVGSKGELKTSWVIKFLKLISITKPVFIEEKFVNLK